jgi:hypothetical protein
MLQARDGQPNSFREKRRNLPAQRRINYLNGAGVAQRQDAANFRIRRAQ